MIGRLTTPLFVKISGALHFLALAGIAFLALNLVGEMRRAAKWEKQALEEAGAHEKTIANYRQAAITARAQDAANARRVERAQQLKTQEISSEYQIKLVDLRRRYERLRRGSEAPTDSGNGGGATMPRLSDPASGPYGTSGEERFSAEERLICSVQAEQLEALQSWVMAQQLISGD